ncbi:MAG TPA: hypothetical protein VMS17_30480 [Gemmataceae bacterium]|nr:hypothetical protein [Gemmataceae bacterium]
MKTRRRAIIAGMAFSLCALCVLHGEIRADEPTPQQVFEKRIMPIFQSPNPSSCTQCHLAAVDLKNYILPSHEKTFLSLRDQGLIDLDAPEKSKILQLIRMGDSDKSGAALIQAKTRQAEYDAFAEWIKASARDPKLRDAPKLDPSEFARPQRPSAVIRHDRADRLLESFENTVWAMRFRCMSCHAEGTPENQKHVKEFGDRVAWMKAGGPAATLDYLRMTKLINLDDPEQSSLLLKPLGAVKHGGGKKFAVGDEGYKAFRQFIEDYAKTVRDQYTKADDLPPDDDPERFGTDAWLKLSNTPPEWGDKLLQVDLYAWDAAKNDWQTEAIASSDRVVWGQGKLWQHNLTLQAPRGSELANKWKADKPVLPRGKYLLKVHVDAKGRLADDWKATLGPDDCVGQAEVTSGWPEGYGKMTEIDAAKVRK